MSEDNWIEVAKADSIDMDDLIRFDYDEKTYCVYKLEDGYYATDGLCTHETVHLEDGLVMDDEIECPMHQGIFKIKNCWTTSRVYRGYNYIYLSCPF